jgi:gliding motility-associated lipoprotein GldB
MIRFSLLICFASLLFASCSFDSEEYDRPQVADIQVSLQIDRLERELFAARSAADVQAFLDQHPQIATYFLQRNAYPHDSVLVNRLYKLIQDPSLDTLYRESQQIFGDLTELRARFTTAFQYIKYYYPEFQPPRIATMVTGFGNDLYVSDSLIVLGLDYYLGDSASFRPVHLPEYIQRRYQPSTIVPTSLLLFSNHFNNTRLDDRSLLAEMIYYGKAYYFVDFVVPDLPDSLLFGYTAEEMAGTQVNRRKIWSHFIENQLLYETSDLLKRKYLDERPKTLEIADKAPGRIATWVGYDIVKTFMQEQEDVNLRELMEDDNARRLFEKANYRPQER